jgi:hypothetical protein
MREGRICPCHDVAVAPQGKLTTRQQYRFADLGYLMQFLQLRMLSQRKGKAAMIAVDQKINDAELYATRSLFTHSGRR